MSERRGGLGRGLGALIPSAPPGPQDDQDRLEGNPPSPRPVDVLFPDRRPEVHQGTVDGNVDPVSLPARYDELAVAAISPNPRQPRQVFDEDAMAELIQSIQTVGLLQPIVVRPLPEDRYELVMGERRWRAAQQAGLESVPAIVRMVDDEHLLRDALLENLHRAELNPLEEAAAYDQLLQDFGCSHDELASRLGRSRPQITNTLRLLRLPPAVQRRLAAGVLTAGHARALLALADPLRQEQVAQRIVAEGLSVRAVEEIVAVGATEGAAAGRRPRAARLVAPKLENLAARLADRLDTRVRIDMGRRKGRITVEFASVDDLERILATLGSPPPAAATPSAPHAPHPSGPAAALGPT